MKIDLDKLPVNVVPNFKGGEKELSVRMFKNEDCTLLKATLAPGASVGEHTHIGNAEAILILSGSGCAVCDGVKESVHAGQVHFCPEGHTHTLINNSDKDLEFYAVIM